MINTKAELSQKAALFLADSLTHCSSSTQTIASATKLEDVDDDYDADDDDFKSMGWLRKFIIKINVKSEAKSHILEQ